jgi:predicted HicB family RNase H-like nuclease
MRKKPKIGRPPLPDGASKEGRLYCRLLESEVAEIVAAARAAKKSKSEWIRDVLLAAAKRKPR